jgi:hypothetical protein
MFGAYGDDDKTADAGKTWYLLLLFYAELLDILY